MTEDLKFKYHFVYKITNKINNKSYIGKHSTNNLEDGYLGSGILILKAVKKYGASNFVKEFLQFFDSLEEAYKNEEKIIKDFDAVNSNMFYNITAGGFGNKGYIPIFTEEWKSKISKALIGRPLSEEHKRNVSIGCTGRSTWNKGAIGLQKSKFKGMKLEGERLKQVQKAFVDVGKHKIQCPYCLRDVLFITSQRWHFENCKLSPIYNPENRKWSEEGKQKLRDSSRAGEQEVKDRTSKSIKELWVKREKSKCLYCDFESKSMSVLSQYHNDNCIHNPNNKNIAKFECPYCGHKSRSISNLKRYHFDKCKYKINEA